MVERVQAGMTFVDGLGIGDVGGEVLRDRRKLAGDGSWSSWWSRSTPRPASCVSGPDIVNRGFVYEETSRDILDEARERVVASIARQRRRRGHRPVRAPAEHPARAGSLFQRGHAAQARDPPGRDGGLRDGLTASPQPVMLMGYGDEDFPCFATFASRYVRTRKAPSSGRKAAPGRSRRPRRPRASRSRHAPPRGRSCRRPRVTPSGSAWSCSRAWRSCRVWFDAGGAGGPGDLTDLL